MVLSREICEKLMTDVHDYDALLIVSFGGPEGPDDVIPFLENVLRGKPVPRERMLEVAEHYNHFGGVSPINEQTRELIDAIRRDFEANGVDLPVYWGNRNWHPYLADTYKQMTEDGVKRALAFVVSGYSCYSGCRQYREDMYRAQAANGIETPWTDKIRTFFNHPDFIAAQADCLAEAVNEFDGAGQANFRVAFTAHSIPTSMSSTSAYVQQLRETARLVSEACGVSSDRWELVYQSRSGRPQDPWLEPDICDHISELGKQGVENLVIMPIGFLSDHMEVMFDLDEEAKVASDEAGISMVRGKTVGVHPRFITMIRKLVLERMGRADVETVGNIPAKDAICPLNCCPPPPAPRRRAGAGRPSGTQRPEGGRPSGSAGVGRPRS